MPLDIIGTAKHFRKIMVITIVAGTFAYIPWDPRERIMGYKSPENCKQRSSEFWEGLFFCWKFHHKMICSGLGNGHDWVKCVSVLQHKPSLASEEWNLKSKWKSPLLFLPWVVVLLLCCSKGNRKREYLAVKGDQVRRWIDF